MSKAYAGLSPISGIGIFQGQDQTSSHSSYYQRLRQLLSEDGGLPHEKSIDGRMNRALDILQAESQVLPSELYLLHSIVSNTVYVVLDNWRGVDYNEFLNNEKGSYPAHTTIIPNNDVNLRKLSELMGVTGLYAGYAKLVERIIG